MKKLLLFLVIFLALSQVCFGAFSPDPNNIIPVLYGNSDPNNQGFIVSAQTEYNATFVTWHAFDRVSNTFWICGDSQGSISWVQVDSPQFFTISSYKITEGSPYNTVSPAGWYFDYSIDGVNWKTVEQRSGIDLFASDETKEFTLPYSVSGKFFKIKYFTVRTTYVPIGEFELIGGQSTKHFLNTTNQYFPVANQTWNL